MRTDARLPACIVPSVCALLWLCGGSPITLQRGPATGMPLVENQKCLVAIVRGTGDELAAGKLADELRKFVAQVPVIASGLGIAVSEPVTLYLGTLQSNPALAEVVSALGWKSEVDKLPAEGYLI